MWSANQCSPQSRRESEKASERAKISTPIICFLPSFIFSKREAPTTVNSARSHSGPEMESDKSRYFGTCFRWETIGKIVPTLPRLRCLPLTETVETFPQNNPPGGAWSWTAALTDWNRKKTEPRLRKEKRWVLIRTCQHLCPLEKVLGADFDCLLGWTGSTGRTGHLAPLRVLCNWHWCLHEDRQTGWIKGLRLALLRADFHILSPNILWLHVDRIWVNLGIFLYNPKNYKKMRTPLMRSRS